MTVHNTMTSLQTLFIMQYLLKRVSLKKNFFFFLVATETLLYPHVFQRYIIDVCPKLFKGRIT